MRVLKKLERVLLIEFVDKIRRMWEIGLRGAAIRYPGWFTIGFLILLVLGGYANWRVLDLRGGILDDALPEDNIYSIMDREARQDGFDPQEVIPIIIKLPDGLKTEKLEEAINISEDLKQLPGGVLSISEMPEYRDTGEELIDSPYLTRETLKNFDPEALQKRLAADSSVEGVLIARNRSWLSWIRFLPPGYSEPQEGWRMVEFLEGRKITLWDRLTKADINPKNQNHAAGGWVMGRWQIDQGLNRDMILLPALGIGIAFFVFWWILDSPRQAAIASLVVVFGGIWFTRAGIWPLHAGYEFFHERVYTILAYANVIVQGISFSLHKLEAFRTAPGATSQEKFLEARRIDGLLGTVALIACFAFFSLNTFEVWQMREMGWQSMLGVDAALTGATLFLPAVYLTLEKILGPEPERAVTEAASRWGDKLIIERRWLRKLAVISGFALPVGTFLFVAFLFLSGRIESHTQPSSYIRGSHVEQTFQFLKKSGNEYLDLLVKPTEGDIYKAAFIREAARFEGALRPRYGSPVSQSRFEEWQKEKGVNRPLGVLEAASVLGKVRQISRESFRKNLPTEDMEVDDIFFLLDSSRLDPEVKRQMWYPGGIRVIASMVMDDSAELRSAIELILKLAREEFPDLKVLTFGKIPVYPQMDLYISQGEAANILVGLSFTFGLYFLWLIWQGNGITYGGKFLIAFFMLSPFLFAIGNMGILMWLFGIPLSMSTAPIFDLSINAASDFSPYIVWAYVAGIQMGKTPEQAVRYALMIMGGIVVADCVLNMVAFFPLWFSSFQPVREIGWIMWLMLGSCVVGALGFVPVLLPYAVRKEKEVNRGKSNLRLVVSR